MSKKRGGVESTQVMEFDARPPETARTPAAPRSPAAPPTALQVRSEKFTLLTGDGHGDQTLFFRAGT